MRDMWRRTVKVVDERTVAILQQGNNKADRLLQLSEMFRCSGESESDSEVRNVHDQGVQGVFEQTNHHVLRLQ